MPQKPTQTQIAHWRYQSDGWKRTLEYLRTEKIYCEHYLSDLVKELPADAETLDEVEWYLDWFAQQETLIALVAADIADFDRLITAEVFEDSDLNRMVCSRCRLLRQEIGKIDKAWRSKRALFDSFIQANA